MGYKLAIFLGLSALLMVLMVDQAESRLVPQEVRSLVELLREDQEDIAPEENAMAARGLGEHDTEQDQKLSKDEMLAMMTKMGGNVDNLPENWFEDADTNGDDFIDHAEFDAVSGQFGGDGGDPTDLARRTVEKARALLEQLRGEQEDIARGLGEHDTDQDQKLSKDEMLAMMTKNGIPVEDLPENWFEDADTNGDDFIDHAEFDAVNEQVGGDGGDQTDLARRTVEKARALLEQLRGEQEDIARGLGEHDTNQDQKLSKDEILVMMTKNGMSVEDLPENWFEDADTNKDGVIDHAEFDAASGQVGGDGGDQTDLARRIVEKARGLLELLREGKRDRYRGQ
ncbi:uncharacterized protein [Branchiostoma lanceolatum]|uniref:uncharacterized protein n=1 Tax=Branchiostoma lanceolatum TaxID=7740 RepID=UPI0034569FB9